MNKKVIIFTITSNNKIDRINSLNFFLLKKKPIVNIKVAIFIYLLANNNKKMHKKNNKNLLSILLIIKKNAYAKKIK